VVHLLKISPDLTGFLLGFFGLADGGNFSFGFFGMGQWERLGIF
jgi:hypothetical protein